MPHKKAKEIIDRYNAGVATEEEKALAENWYAHLMEECVPVAES